MTLDLESPPPYPFNVNDSKSNAHPMLYQEKIDFLRNKLYRRECLTFQEEHDKENER